MERFTLHYTPRARVEVPIVLGRGAVSLLPSILQDLACDSVHVIADAEVHRHLSSMGVRDLLAGFRTLLHPAGEIHKNLASLQRLCDGFFAQGGGRDSCIVAIGGGVTGNMAGLVAALAYRGVHLVHVPTTLIGQLDSAVDVKQSVNCTVKNALGAYYPPSAVVVDPDLLATLPRRHLRSGLAEAMKHGFAQDMRLVDLVVTADLGDQNRIEAIISSTIQLKLAHYHASVNKWQERVPVKLLTHLGHSVGKVLETLCLGEITHGEAISHGMVAESILSWRVGLLSYAEAETVRSVLARASLLPELPPSCAADIVVARLCRGREPPTFPLLAALGQDHVVTMAVSSDLVADALQQWSATVSQR